MRLKWPSPAWLLVEVWSEGVRQREVNGSPVVHPDGVELR